MTAGPRDAVTRHGSRIGYLLVTLLAVVLMAGCQDDQATITIFTATSQGGSGAAALIDGPDFTVVMDSGWPATSDRYRSIPDLLVEAGVDEIDLLVGSHPHRDHIGQHADIIKQFDVSMVWMPGHTPYDANDRGEHEVFSALMDVIETTGLDYMEPRAGDAHSIGGLTLTVLHPTELMDSHTTHGAINHDSLVIHVEYGQRSVKFPGDARHRAEEEMLEAGVPEADVLVLGHHGHADATSPEWVAAVSPELAVYSNRSIEAPDADVLAALDGIPLYGTGVHGDITITTDGVSLKVETEVDEPPFE